MEKLIRFQLEPENIEKINRLCGPTNSTLKQMEKELQVKISNRGKKFKVKGRSRDIKAAEVVLKELYERLEVKKDFTPRDIHFYLREAMNRNNNSKDSEDIKHEDNAIYTPKSSIIPKGVNQKKYLDTIFDKDMTFGIGPAGTGKTYLAVAVGVQYLIKGKVEKLLLTRPAVEAGEKLGFLPGDLNQKIDPYLRPLYDALFITLGFKETSKLIENNVIEIAPLAFMRGRTINNSFIILDESQNTTKEQMKMFLTRMGYGSKVVITGDLTQIDLQEDSVSGLVHALDVLKKVKEVGVIRFESTDVIRHSLVQKIVEAYESFKKK